MIWQRRHAWIARLFPRRCPMFKPDFKRPQLSYEELQVEMVAPNVVNAAANCVMSGGDPRVQRRGRISLIMHKVNDRWHIVHDHTH